MRWLYCIIIMVIVSCGPVFSQEVSGDFNKDYAYLKTLQTLEEVIAYANLMIIQYKDAEPVKKLKAVNYKYNIYIIFNDLDKAVLLLPELEKAARETSISDELYITDAVARILANRSDKYPDQVIYYAKRGLKLLDESLPRPQMMYEFDYMNDEFWKNRITNSMKKSLEENLGWGYYYKGIYKKALKYWPVRDDRYLIYNKGVAKLKLKRYTEAFQDMYLAKLLYEIDNKDYPKGFELYYSQLLSKLPKSLNVEAESKIIYDRLIEKQRSLVPLSEKNMEGIPFSLTLLNGEKVSNESLKGNVVILNFWSEECGDSLSEMPGLSKLYQEYKDQGLVVLGANCEKNYTEKELPELGKKYKFNYPIGNIDDEFNKKFSILGIPVTYIYDKKGRIRYYNLGFKTGHYLVMKLQVEKLLAE